jgi:hypothetical protein
MSACSVSPCVRSSQGRRCMGSSCMAHGNLMHGAHGRHARASPVVFAALPDEEEDRDGSVGRRRSSRGASSSAGAQAVAAPPPYSPYSPLHAEIDAFCRAMAPTDEEDRAKHDVVERCVSRGRRGVSEHARLSHTHTHTYAHTHTPPATRSIRVAVRKAFPEGRGRVAVRVFGSFASGMGTWDSDVDLVVTGLFAPDAHTGGACVCQGSKNCVKGHPQG